jgi:hypothetical protein
VLLEASAAICVAFAIVIYGVLGATRRAWSGPGFPTVAHPFRAGPGDHPGGPAPDLSMIIIVPPNGGLPCWTVR